MKGNDRAVDSPIAKKTTASGPNSRERMRMGGVAVVVAVTASRYSLPTYSALDF